jgi:hypothetical protein
LYNVQDLSKDSLIRKLRARREKFANTERTVSAILHFSDLIIKDEQSQRPDPDFYSCEFVGFLDPAETQVGCMLHPLAQGNQSIDWRGLSFHGAMACQGFFCRSFRELSSEEKRVVLDTVHGWYLYGLVISDVDYAKSFFRMADENLGRRVALEKLRTPPASELVHDFLHWKIDWPFRKLGTSVTGAETSRVVGVKHDPGGEQPLQETLAPIDLFFKSLGSEFQSVAERRNAEQMVDQLFSLLGTML